MGWNLWSCKGFIDKCVNKYMDGARAVMNPQVDDENETTLSLFPLPHRKIWFEGTGIVGRIRSLAKSAKALHRPTIPTLVPT